jgi:hypothetical protein
MAKDDIYGYRRKASSVDHTDVQRNEQLLKDRPWFAFQSSIPTAAAPFWL